LACEICTAEPHLLQGYPGVPGVEAELESVDLVVTMQKKAESDKTNESELKGSAVMSKRSC
jgi:hypothetical protein